MIGFILLFLIFLHGLALSSILFKSLPLQIKILSGFIFGSIVNISFIYWVTCLTKSLDVSLLLFFFFSIQLIMIFHKQYMQSIILFRKLSKLDYGIFFALLAFSYYVFSKTFGYDAIHGNFLIASNVYMDFGAHIPFIRSFSSGSNFPGEVPFFAQGHLPYYFLFDFYSGVLEHVGIRIDIAYNILSSLSFTFLLTLIYNLGSLVFKSRKIGIISVVLFLFSSNLSFLEFFQKSGLHISTVSAWWHNNFYLEESGFWNLNPYMNQRHLVFGMAFLFLFLYVWLFFLKEKETINKRILILLGISLGLLPMWHAMIFIMTLMIMMVMVLVYKKNRKQLLIVICIALCISLPQLLFIKFNSANTIVFKPGFIIENMLNIQNVALYWIHSLGISIITITIGFFISSREQKKFFLLFVPLFILPNLFHFSSRYPFDDHKYFLVWIAAMNMVSAYAVIKLFSKNYVYKMLSAVVVVLLTLSGLISIMVIKNDVKTTIIDYPNSPLLKWVDKNIPDTETIFTNGEIYDPITLVGKKTFLGRTQYIYNYGGNYTDRLQDQHILLQPNSLKDMMNTAKKNSIHYIVLYKNNFAKNEKTFNQAFYNANLKKIYEDSSGAIFKI